MKNQQDMCHIHKIDRKLKMASIFSQKKLQKRISNQNKKLKTRINRTQNLVQYTLRTTTNFFFMDNFLIAKEIRISKQRLDPPRLDLKNNNAGCQS